MYLQLAASGRVERDQASEESHELVRGDRVELGTEQQRVRDRLVDQSEALGLAAYRDVQALAEAPIVGLHFALLLDRGAADRVGQSHGFLLGRRSGEARTRAPRRAGYHA